MRFKSNGPDIPGELLMARDEGKVVFFCGAGVSLAKAGLPDFFRLAERVTNDLGVVDDDPAMKLLKESASLAIRIGVDGIIPADRIFGLLAQDFEETLIESSVIKALTPSKDVDLSAHRTLLDLAKTPNGQIKLVTTNFDRLFCQCEPSLKANHPKHLSKSWSPAELDGVVYLHGCSDKKYKRAEGDGFVLTSASFGRAYLSEGWATDFIQTILQDHHVVFVGYSADDPPVQYLLEALNHSKPTFGNMYVFHAGTTDDGFKKWASRSVTPIVYSDDNYHIALWDTLREWQIRAKNPAKWMESVIGSAIDPRKLAPYERGQVTHIVSSTKGANIFAETRPLPSAQWLSVFLPHGRYATPKFLSREELVLGEDPFTQYGLDCDEPPSPIELDYYPQRREPPADAFNVFKHQIGDFDDEPRSSPSTFDYLAVQPLPKRLGHLGYWIAKSAGQAEILRWAINQNGLHPTIAIELIRRLELDEENVEPYIERAWHYLFDSWAYEKKGRKLV